MEGRNREVPFSRLAGEVMVEKLKSKSGYLFPYSPCQSPGIALCLQGGLTGFLDVMDWKNMFEPLVPCSRVAGEVIEL